MQIYYKYQEMERGGESGKRTVAPMSVTAILSHNHNARSIRQFARDSVPSRPLWVLEQKVDSFRYDEVEERLKVDQQTRNSTSRVGRLTMPSFATRPKRFRTRTHVDDNVLGIFACPVRSCSITNEGVFKCVNE